MASTFCWVASVMRRLRPFIEMLFTPYFATKQSLRGIFFERPLESPHLLGRHQDVAGDVFPGLDDGDLGAPGGEVWVAARAPCDRAVMESSPRRAVLRRCPRAGTS